MKFIRLFVIAVAIVIIFFGTYLKLYVGEYMRYGRLKNIHERVCPLITTKDMCRRLGCIDDPIEIMPAPGKPSWFCRAKNVFSK